MQPTFPLSLTILLPIVLKSDHRYGYTPLPQRHSPTSYHNSMALMAYSPQSAPPSPSTLYLI
ncbi:unnamed protein product [Arabis nemorensis]|uniref:Uncharacterized protein n=1 Tax=Arabis nemorensis TaxID=586526 RepID=A0A565BTY4_9BRAS|nr:unnamed protein product [Arabis nemorensis]